MKRNPRNTEWVAVDGRGNDIPGTNNYYKKGPRVGRWRKITPQPCCSAFELSATLVDVTDDTFSIHVKCDAVDFLVATVILPAATLNIHEVVSGLNQYAPYIGKWSTDGTLVELQLNAAVAKQCGGTLTFTIAAA